jgi:CO/xanthine dehydrogenase FAD-binding subunit
VRCALGSVGPVPLRAHAAEGWLADRDDWDRVRLVEDDAASEFGRMVAASARPIDDHRSTATYRRHGVRVLAERMARHAFGAAA